VNGKNILVLSPTPSHPQDAGNRKRIYALTKYLQELGATIYFVYCPREWDREIPQAAYDGMNQCWDYFFVSYPVQRSVHQTDEEYFEIDAWWDVGIEFTVNWIKLAVDMDMVLCNYVFYSKVLDLFDRSVTKVIDTHDIVSNRNYLLEKKLGYRDFFFTSPKSEQKALDRADLVLSIKEDESSWFKCLSQTPVLTIGHLEPEPVEVKPREIDYGNIKLGFIGSANPINCKNLESFLDEYLNTYAKSAEQFTFVVGGKICQVLDKRFHDRIHLLGLVDDVSEFYEEIDIVVLPFEFSTGLKIKTVEALSWDKPCIGTINAFEGLDSSCHYHSFKGIKQLAAGIEDLIINPKSVIAQLRQDSESVRTNYANKVKNAIKKLYDVNWHSVKQLQTASNPAIKPAISTKYTPTYNFNLITNIDFWKSNSNAALWINFWIANSRKLGNVNIFRTKNFSDISSDKQVLYRLGLVNNVHHRELDRIVDLFKIPPDDNQIFINLVDFTSIVRDRDRLTEIKRIKLAKNHYLWCFFNQLNIEANDAIREYASQMLNNNSIDLHRSYLWDADSSLIPASNSKNTNIKLLEHPINIRETGSLQSLDLEQIIIGTSCTNQKNIAQFKKLAFCCQEFLPNNFELVVISDLESVKNNYANVRSIREANEIIPTTDLFVCLEDPQAISFLIYLCTCKSIPLAYKDKSFTEALARHEYSMPLNSFTSIPEMYRKYLRLRMSNQRQEERIVMHDDWENFVQYWLNQVSVSQHNSPTMVQKLANQI